MKLESRGGNDSVRGPGVMAANEYGGPENRLRQPNTKKTELRFACTLVHNLPVSSQQSMGAAEGLFFCAACLM